MKYDYYINNFLYYFFIVFFGFVLSKFLTFIIYVNFFHLFIGLFPPLFFILLFLCLLRFLQHKNYFF